MDDLQGPITRTRLARMEDALRAGLAPLRLEVTDDSARHAGHAGAQPGGETHYSVLVVSEQFRNLGRVARSRLVHAIVAEELGSGLHALSLTLRAPGEG